MEGNDMDFEAIKAAAQNYQADMTRFLREMISHCLLYTSDAADD